METPHAVLGVSHGAARTEIRAAFRKRVLECHPDAGGSDAEFRRVREAYEELTITPETREDEAERIYREMERATEWARHSSGTAGFGNIELVKHGRSVKIVGRMKAGRFRFDGRIISYGDVSSPPWGAHRTVLSGDTIHIEGNLLNGATVRGRSILAVDVFGLKRAVKDPVRVGVVRNAPLRTRIVAGDNAVLRNCHGPADIRGGLIDVCDVRDGCAIEARRAIIRGSTVTHDCMIDVSESLSFTTTDVLGLSDDCTVSWPGGKIRLGRLKPYRISRLPGHGGAHGTMVGNGFVITVPMLEHVAAKGGWNPFA